MNRTDIPQRYVRHPEDIKYMKHGTLPEQFRAAQRFYEKMIQNKDWYDRYEGQFVAIMHQEIIATESLDDTLDRAYTRWGYRPIFCDRVEPPKDYIPHLPRPNATR